MPAGTPIRLVQENGNLIELDAQSMVLTTTRKVGGKPIPFTGSKRLGLDLNINSAMINIQGIIADDRIGNASVSAYAIINFTKRQGIDDPFITSGNLSALTSGKKLKLENFDGSSSSIVFTSTGGATEHSSGTDTVNVNTSTATAAQLATAVTTCINTRFSSDFTAVTVEVEDGEGETQTGAGVRITLDALGEVKGNITPAFFNPSTYTFVKPHINTFTGGKTGTKKSAGDKAMDLYGILNNSATTAGRVVGSIIGGALLTIASGGLGAGAAIVGIHKATSNEEIKDYIIGLQIPYNSSIQAGDGELYSARNFFMPTGWKWGLDKTSDRNTNEASVKFSTSDEYTGIQGSIQKMDITYDAGETVYQFNMIFAPIDNLM